VLVTAGPTEEPIDEVRFIGNRSSGRLGIAVARAFADLGAEVVLALGPVRVAPPDAFGAPEHAGRVRVERFRTSRELLDLMARELPRAEIVVMAAAVADFRPTTRLEGKMRRGGLLTLELEPVEDLLTTTAAFRRPEARVFGFALEPRERLAASARDKLERKALAGIVANPLETMDAADIDATLYLRDGRARRAAPEGTRIAKDAFARWLAGEILGDAP
jgi:phosphopantothenoylcysteine decarboxylase / phosphopantothenate---cysteine ligase